MTIHEVAKALGKSPQFVRICLQRGLLPFGTATKLPNSTRWTYVIFPEKVKEYVGKETSRA